MSVLLRASKICFAYGGADVLHDVDLTLCAGTLTAIVGTNGSGKSTMMEILAGVRKPRRGTVVRRGSVALVVQRAQVPELLPLTVRETVAMGTWGKRRSRRAVRATTDDALARVALDDLGHRSLHELSGGQRQRALIAQAIARGADILLLDEPAAGLDVTSRKRTREILAAEASEGRAIGWITHDERDAAYADSCVRLVDGRVVSLTPSPDPSADPA